MLKICLFVAIFEPGDAYKGDAYKKKRVHDNRYEMGKNKIVLRTHISQDQPTKCFEILK